LSSLVRKIALSALAPLLAPLAASSLTVQIGVWMGSRTVADPKVRSAYGDGSVYLPYFQAAVWRKLFVGASYEGGYEKNGVLGVYSNPSTLTIIGLDLYLGYEFKFKAVAAYLKAGYGLYRYRQSVRNNPYIADYRVDHLQSTAVAGAGIKLYPLKFFFVSGEAKYVPLKVRPYDYTVDLGGWRFLGGLGFSFNF
jgi:hypothetical protein